MKSRRVGTLHIMTVAEVAESLKVDKSTVYRLIRDREIPAFKVGADWRFDKGAIEKWLVEQQLQGGAKQ